VELPRDHTNGPPSCLFPSSDASSPSEDGPDDSDQADLDDDNGGKEDGNGPSVRAREADSGMGTMEARYFGLDLSTPRDSQGNPTRVPVIAQ
jgi:hypothetical protein